LHCGILLPKLQDVANLVVGKGFEMGSDGREDRQPIRLQQKKEGVATQVAREKREQGGRSSSQ